MGQTLCLFHSYPKRVARASDWQVCNGHVCQWAIYTPQEAPLQPCSCVREAQESSKRSFNLHAQYTGHSVLCTLLQDQDIKIAWDYYFHIICMWNNAITGPMCEQTNTLWRLYTGLRDMSSKKQQGSKTEDIQVNSFNTALCIFRMYYYYYLLECQSTHCSV